jgi:outer membrane lipoprotein-sorting protein
MLSGCASPSKSKKVGDQEKAKAVAYREYTLKDLRDELVGRQRQLKAISGNASVEWASRVTPGGRQSVTGMFAFEMPNKVRMTLGKPLTSFQAELISDGDRFWMVNHTQKTVQTGKCENLVGVDTDRIPIRPMDIVDVFFLRELMTADQAGFAKRITFLETIGNYYIISVLRDDFSNLLYSKIWVDRFTANPVRHQLYDSEKGSVRVDATLGDYQSVGGVSIPHALTINWPSQLTSLDVQFKGCRVNPKWENPNIFIFETTKPDYVYHDADASAKAEQGYGLRERSAGAAPPAGYPPQPGAPPLQRQPTAPGARKAAEPPPPEPIPDYVPRPNPYRAKKSPPPAEQ